MTPATRHWRRSARSRRDCRRSCACRAAMLSAQAGLVAMSITFRGGSPAARVRPFRTSQWRWPSTCRSMVSTSALHFAAAARSISDLHEAAVLHHVELEPERLVDRAGHVLDRADRHGGQRVRNARPPAPRGRRGSRRRHAACRASADRRRAPSGTGTGSPRMVVPRSRCETSTSTRWRSLMRFEVGAVGPQRLLGIGAGLGVVEEHLRHLAPRELPQVLDAGDGAHAGHHIRRVPLGERPSGAARYLFQGPYPGR